MEGYRSLVAWKRAHQAALEVLRVTDRAYHPRALPVFAQARRAAVSIEANVVEGYALGTVPLFRRHLRIALGSAAEAECLLRLAGELGYLDAKVVGAVESLLGATMRAIRGLIRQTPTLRT